jgi:probable FeS assembly SUF system protein SufT
VGFEDIITVSRDVDAVLIPLGTPVTIPAGSEVRVTQKLGDSFTVSVNMNLARIEGKDADAFGLGEDFDDLAESGKHAKADGPVNVNDVWEILKNCYDPEIPVNIVDLGLIYEVLVADSGEVGGKVTVVMTLTAPGCGMGPFIVDDVRAKAMSVKNVTDVHVQLVFDPPWDRSRMSDDARLQLGMF